MENKYYTPEIEEFRIGFEFEKYDNRPATYKENDFKPTNWHKHTYNLTSIRLSQLGTHLYNKTLRVKYLDKEDIESLGSVYTGGRLVKNSIDIFNYKKDSSFEYVLKYNYSVNKLEVYKEDLNYFETSDNCLFNGTIKNLSELKVVLKQLNVLPSSI